MDPKTEQQTLSRAVVLNPAAVLNPDRFADSLFSSESPVLVVLAAGKGTRFGTQPKCIQPVAEVPLARHSINGFRSLSNSPCVCLVAYQAERVARALGDDNLYIRSSDPAGGTAMAAYESFAWTPLLAANPVVVITMGDRIVPESIFRKLLEEHQRGDEADLTLMTAIYQPPLNQGKGRILRDSNAHIDRIVEQRDIDALPKGAERDRLQSHPEGNCPLYAARAQTLYRYLGKVTDHNAQQQYYFTDIVEAIGRDQGVIRSITISDDDPRYNVLCADVTRPGDLVRLEKVMSDTGDSSDAVSSAAASIVGSRPTGQIESIAAQLDELASSGQGAKRFQNEMPIGIGISGGRLRIAFMHPDMSRFYGPAWQMPIGAPDPTRREQIVVMMQSTHDGLLRLNPTDPQFREVKDSLAADAAFMYPGPEVCDFHGYEVFGTQMAVKILSELGYRTDVENRLSRQRGEPTPPQSQWVSNNMRRPFSLLANAIASIRTVREGMVGDRIKRHLGRASFTGLNVVSTGNIPRGGFSSSSAVTVATQNAVNSLFELGISPDHLVDLACQAEYGTGVLAGALDQATEQKGVANEGALISSNPRENYRIIRNFPVPTQRFSVLFPFTVDRDREAWRWSMGCYGDSPDHPKLTTSETRKMTGKVAEIAAILLRMPLDRDFFQEIEDDLVETGSLTTSTALHVQDRLRAIPLLATKRQLAERLETHAAWYSDQLMLHHGHDRPAADGITRVTFDSILSGWRDPLLTRCAAGRIVEETGVPLRAMLGYLYGEVVKNCYLVHHPRQWIKCVTQSQRGDRCFDIEPAELPDKSAMLTSLPWEKPFAGRERMECWLNRYAAQPFDFNAGLSDADLADRTPVDMRVVGGTNFFRGLPLIDLAEAMLKRAFGHDAIAVRVNGAGQGDYFQVHVDRELADTTEVKHFIQTAFYDRFSLDPENPFVEPHPGGGAVGIKLDRFDQLPELADELRRHAGRQRQTIDGLRPLRARA